MATAIETPATPRLASRNEDRVVLRGVSWETYRRLVEETGDDRRSLMAFNRGVLEIMSPGPLHEEEKMRLRRVVEIVSEEMAIPCKNLGSTTWTQEGAERGIEADECFYFERAKIAEARDLLQRRVNDAAEYPPPDLAIEIDISRSAVDRPEVYSSLGVREVLRFQDRSVRIDRLGVDGRYAPSETSLFLPLRPEDIARLVLLEAEDDTAWAREVRAWIRDQLAGRA